MKMHDLVASFPVQIKDAIKVGLKAEIKKSIAPINNILITGLGGSGIGGTIVSQLLENQLDVPVILNKDYSLPNFVSENTLVIVSSYSGNTEETYNVLKDAFLKDAKIICITSGGKVLHFAQNNGIDYIEVEGGYPPRSRLGSSIVQQLFAFYHMGFIEEDFIEQLEVAAEYLIDNQSIIREQAKDIANQLHETLPIIYCDAAIEGVAIRFRQQINENAKMLCWHHVIPEMNHNELVGWTKANEQLSVVFLVNEDDFERNKLRMEFTEKVVRKYCDKVVHIFSKGNSKIERALHLIHLTDWVSCYLSDLNGSDAVEIDVINKLKGTLAETPFNI